MAWIADRHHRLVQVCRRDIWHPAALKERGLRGRIYAVLRVISITYTGLFENHITTRAAALSYASLLGFGPLVALGMLVAGFMLHQRDPDMVINALNRAVKFIAPQVAQYEHLDRSGGQPPAPGSASAAEPGAPAPAANQALRQLISSFVAGSRSGTAGVVGALTLILIVLQLFTWVENAFNGVWGVRRGRSWMLRVAFYWTIITLGTILFFASLTALSAAAFINVFFAKLPMGRQLVSLLQWMLPALSVLLLMGVLMIFYRYIPNTRVWWRAALVGAVIVTALLFLNNYLAFLYFKRVMLQKSLYGSLGILPILMLGLYIFWFFVLLGGQISYAVQNANFRSSQAAWQNLSEDTRETLSLLILLAVGRRFKECRPAYSVTQIGQLIKAPTQVINQCLNRLNDLGLIAPIPPADSRAVLDYRYQPARPLNRITLADFKKIFITYGENTSPEMFEAVDPVLQFYRDRFGRYLREDLGQQSLDSLLDEFPAAPAPG